MQPPVQAICSLCKDVAAMQVWQSLSRQSTKDVPVFFNTKDYQVGVRQDGTIWTNGLVEEFCDVLHGTFVRYANVALWRCVRD